MAKFPLSASGSVTFANDTGYLSLSGYQTALRSTANEASIILGGTSTFDELYVNVTAFSSSNSPTVSRNSAASTGNPAVTLTGTGEFRDATNTYSTGGAGSNLRVFVDNSAGGHGDAITVDTIKSYLAPTSGNGHLVGGAITNACDYANLAQTVYVPALNDVGSEYLTESFAAQNLVTAQNLSRLDVYASVASGNPTATTRKNSANTSQTVTMTGAGSFADTTNSVSTTAGDDFDLAVTTAGSMDDVTLTTREWWADATSAWIGGRRAGTLGAVYLRWGSSEASTSTDKATYLYCRDDAATIKNLCAVVITKGSSNDPAITVYKNGGSTSCTVTVTATGTFTDTSNTVSLADGDYAQIQKADETAAANTYSALSIEWDTAADSGGALTGSGAAASAGAGSLARLAQLDGTGANATTGTANVLYTIGFDGTGAVSSAGTADLTVGVTGEAVALDGTGAVSSAGTGDPAVTVTLTGTGAVATTGTAELLLRADLTGTGANATTGNAALNLTLDFTGSGANATAGTSAILLTVALDGTGAVATAGTADLTVTAAPAAGEVSLDGSGAVSSAGTADPALTLTVDGSGAVATTGTGALDLTLDLAGSGSAANTGTAALDLTLTLDGTGAAATTGTAEILLTLTLDGTGAAATTGTSAILLTVGFDGTGAAATTGTGDITVTAAAGESVTLDGSGAAATAGIAELVLTVALDGAGAASTTGEATLAGTEPEAEPEAEEVGGGIRYGVLPPRVRRFEHRWKFRLTLDWYTIVQAPDGPFEGQPHRSHVTRCSRECRRHFPSRLTASAHGERRTQMSAPMVRHHRSASPRTYREELLLLASELL